MSEKDQSLTVEEVQSLGEVLGRSGLSGHEQRLFLALVKEAPHSWREMYYAHQYRTVPSARDGMYRSLKDNLEMVRYQWPDVSGEMVDEAIKDAVRRIPRFLETNKRPATHLNQLVAISVHRSSLIETALYGRDRLLEAFGRDNFWQHKHAAGNLLSENDKRNLKAVFVEGRVRITRDRGGLPIAPERRDCVRFDLINVTANQRKTTGMIPAEHLHATDLAGVELLFAAAQHPEWIRRTSPHMPPYTRMPNVIVGGLQLLSDVTCQWNDRPVLYCADGIMCLLSTPEYGKYCDYAMPCIAG